MIEIIKQNLKISDLKNKAEVLEILESDDAKYDIKNNSVSREILLEIYEFRSEHLSGKNSEHAAQLRDSVNELCDNLRRADAENLFFTSVKQGEVNYTLFTDKETGCVLGCLKTISQLKVSPEKWNEIWKETW